MKKSKLTRNIIFTAAFLIILALYTFYIGMRNNINNISLEKSLKKFSRILNLKDRTQISQKTPRDLFYSFTYSIFYAWCGYFTEMPIAINCISPLSNDQYPESEKEILTTKCLKLSLLMADTNFSIQDVPETVDGDTCKIKLGYGKNAITFYLAKRKSGDWYFTEENFTDPETAKRLNSYDIRYKFVNIKGRDYKSPLSCYVHFILGVNNIAGLNIEDAREIMDLSWINPIIREQYGNFLAFIIQKVTEKEKVNIFAMPKNNIENEVAVILCSSKSGKTIYFEKIDNGKKGVTWKFNRQVQANALYIYMNEKMELDYKDPAWFLLQHKIYNNKLFNKLFIFSGSWNLLILGWICFLAGCITSFTVYKLGRIIIYFILNIIISFFSVIKHYSHYQKYAMRLTTALSAIAALYCFEVFTYHYTIFYYNLFLLYNYFLIIAYQILIIWALCELISLVCAVVSFLIKHTGNERFRTIFVIEIIQRLICILIIVILTGMLFQKLGLNMVHFFTALGIGGLAIAFAGKDMIENLFGSIMITIERPFKIGDWIVVGNIEGVVEHVGLRSTRVRSFQDSYITVPNVEFITSFVNNMGERNFRRYYTTVEVDESTAPELLQAFTEGIEKIIKNSPSMKQKDYYVKVNDLGHFSIKIMVYVFFIASTWEAELHEREKLILSILKLAKKLNVKLSYYPAQTLYLAGNNAQNEKSTENLSLKQLNKKTLKARKTAKKIVRYHGDTDKR